MAGRDEQIAAALRRGHDVKLRRRLSCPGRFRLPAGFGCRWPMASHGGPPPQQKAEEVRKEKHRRRRSPGQRDLSGGRERPGTFADGNADWIVIFSKYPLDWMATNNRDPNICI
jgi:hypothetical protein